MCSNVLLYAAVDHAVLLYVDRLTQETGGYVSNQRLTLGVRQLFIFCTINGVVFADVNIVRIIINGQIGAVRDIGESLILRRGNLYSLAVLLCLLISLLCPLTSDNIVCHAVLHQIHGNSCKLLRGTALEEQYLIVIGDTHEVTQILFSGLDDLIEGSTAVAHFHHRHTCSLIIQHFISGLTQNLFRQNRRTCTEIVYSMHCQYPPVEKNIHLSILCMIFQNFSAIT